MRKEPQNIASYFKVIVSFWVLVIVLTGISMESKGLPQGGVVTDGSASITTNPNYMQINQNSNNAVLNWQSFNINSNEHVNFLQPNSSSIAINRINAANGPSEIFGRLTANGTIFLLNPSGILFGANSQINVGNILASTSDLNLDKYRKFGTIELMPNNNYNGSIINKGNISVRDAGFAAFVSPTVENQGIINARLGHVQLSSGEYFTVDLYGDNLINFKIPDTALNPALRNYSVNQNGAIFADGGNIAISASDAGNIVSSIVSFDGVARADSVANKTGKISLSNSQGSVNIAGNSKISAAGNDFNTSGGLVKVSGQDITLAQNSLIDASGSAGGGTVNIGGNYQGKINSADDYNAKTVTMQKDATIVADAKTSGNGGNIVLWSDDTTKVDGTLSAKNAAGNSNSKGGSIETSGKVDLLIGENTKVNAGKNGSWLLDPENITIDDTQADIFNNSLANETNVEVRTNLNDNPDENGDITFANTNTPISWSTAANFSAIADNSMTFLGSTDTFSPNIQSLGLGNITLKTNADGTYDADSKYNSFIFIGANNYDSPFVISSGGGLLDYYYDPVSLGTPLSIKLPGPIDPETGKPGKPVIIATFSATGNSIMNEYQYIYDASNEVAVQDGRDIYSAAASGIGTSSGRGDISSASDILSVALNEDIDLLASESSYGKFSGFANGRSVFLGNFDGLNHTLSGFSSDSLNPLLGNGGLFSLTDSTIKGKQEFKNLRMTSANLDVTSGKSDNIGNGGLLIGHAGNAGSTLTISNVSIENSNLAANQKDGSPIDGNAGALIGNIKGGTLNLQNISVNNTNITSSGTAGGLVGKSSSNNINLSGNINLTSTTVSANLPRQILGLVDGETGELGPAISADTYAGGLIGRTTSAPLVFNADNSDISISNANISSINNLPGVKSFTGGLIGDFIGQSASFNEVFISAMNLGAQVNYDTTLGLTNTSPLYAYAGGLFGHANLTNLTFNNITIDATPNAVAISEGAESALAAAGGLTGHQESTSVVYKGALSTNGAQASSTLDTAAFGSANYAKSYAGGIDGLVENNGSDFNHQYNANSAINVSDTVSANSTGAQESAFAGGMYGLVSDNTNTSRSSLNIANNNPITLAPGSLIFTSISGNGTANSLAEKLTKATASGGLIGGANGIDVTFNNNSAININSNVIATGRSIEADQNSPIQAVGGVIGLFANGDFNFNPANPNFAVTVTSQTPNTNSSGYAGGVIGYLDVAELTPSSAAVGNVSPDATNDSGDWANGGANFTFTNTSACGGPSAGLCAASNGGGNNGGGNTGGGINNVNNVKFNEYYNSIIPGTNAVANDTKNSSSPELGYDASNQFIDNSDSNSSDDETSNGENGSALYQPSGSDIELKGFEFNNITSTKQP